MTLETVDLRSRRERRVRSAWRASPGIGLRAGAALYAAVEDTRHALYDLGVLAARHPGVPVVSVGGLTVGGSGKTPLAAEVAGWLRDHGLRPAVITHGFLDEMEVHGALGSPDRVFGGRDRERTASLAASSGADALVVDSGFQRRSLARDLDVLAVTTADLIGARHRLPAGPLREGWSSVGRADALVVVRRAGHPPLPSPTERWLARLGRRTTVARLALRPGELAPVNDPAASTRPSIAVAVSSVMEPDRFIDALAARGILPEARFVLPDHGDLDAESAERILARAGERGIVGTLKDRAKLAAALGDGAPLWWLRDVPEWTDGETRLRRRVLRVAGGRA